MANAMPKGSQIDPKLERQNAHLKVQVHLSAQVTVGPAGKIFPYSISIQLNTPIKE